MAATVSVNISRERASYDANIGVGALAGAGQWVNKTIGVPAKTFIVSNKKIFALHGESLQRSLNEAGLATSVHLIGDGERFKNLKTLDAILNAFSQYGISRTDAVIGFGGGVVGDIAGFAASVYLRGIDFLQIPTTLLAMVDASVGGKTGVNTVYGKNLVGTFYQPKGVLIDPDVLFTLPKREITAGLCECIKHAATSGTDLFNETISTLDLIKQLKNKELPDNFEEFLTRQIAFKAEIVKQDEREAAQRLDKRSRKVLNFGHTFAHALEKATDYRYLKHGEAVGYGILFAAEISKNLGLLDEKVVNLLRDVVCQAGKLPPINNVDPETVFASLRYDKKRIDRSINWVLLKRIGKPLIVPHEQVGDRLVRRTIMKFISSDQLPK